ncbi:hypothetical protein AB0C27_48095 [Nonomuraea sp. NPDC048882]|uniref:hypothetical protein n=1 Tax=Nonomuraea sp. NPDC048882 TaxID=3154347 RepID=UPI0033CE7457
MSSEAGGQVGASIAKWGHVRVFSPWRYNIDAAARRLLNGAGWQAPDDDWLPTGAEIIEDYLAPLAKVLGDRVRVNARVSAITCLGFDRVRTNGRQDVPFLIRLENGEELYARAIIDASGTYTTPNVLGASGLPAHGEADVAALIDHALPDVPGRIALFSVADKAAAPLAAVALAQAVGYGWVIGAVASACAIAAFGLLAYHRL